MKRLVTILFVLSGILFISNPVLKSSFANNNSNSQILIDSKKDLTNNQKETLKSKTLVKDAPNLNEINYKNSSIITNVDKNDDLKQIDTEKENSNNIIYIEDKNNIITENTLNNNSNSSDINQENQSMKYTTLKNSSNETISKVKTLTMEDALKLLNEMNPNLTYKYKGDENTFPALKDKGFSGYVFLPNVDTDLGYFVDKNTSSIYYFHPSGYLEKIK